jgi:hypothetical protein
MSTRLLQTLKQYRHDGTRYHFIFPQTQKRKGLCKVIHCKRPAREQVRWEAGKLRLVHHGVCITCQSRLYRANNPAKEAYRQIKDRAFRRNQVFRLTFDEFLTAIEGTDYLTCRGTGIGELHLDRIRVADGYVPGNLQVITTAENLRKQREVDYCRGPF